MTSSWPVEIIRACSEPPTRFTTRASASKRLARLRSGAADMDATGVPGASRPSVPFGAHSAQAARRIMAPRSDSPHVATSRNAPLCTGLAVGAGGFGARLMATGAPAVVDAQRSDPAQGDLAICRFLAAEILESDLWIPYSKYGRIQDSDISGGTGSAMYTTCMHILDADLSEYTRDNAGDVNRYMQFLKACPGQLHRQEALVSGTERVDASRVATLKGSTVDSVNKNTIGKRLTNLLAFNVDIRWWEHYCSTENPDLGGTCAQAATALSQPIERFPAISRNIADFASPAAPRQRLRLSSKRSLTLRASNWVLSGPAASVSTPRWRRMSMTRWCCVSCSVSARPRPSAFRPVTKGRQCARVYDIDQRMYVDVSKPGGQQDRAPQGQPDHARAMRRCQQESAPVRHHPSDAGTVWGAARLPTRSLRRDSSRGAVGGVLRRP